MTVNEIIQLILIVSISLFTSFNISNADFISIKNNLKM